MFFRIPQRLKLSLGSLMAGKASQFSKSYGLTSMADFSPQTCPPFSSSSASHGSSRISTISTTSSPDFFRFLTDWFSRGVWNSSASETSSEFLSESSSLSKVFSFCRFGTLGLRLNSAKTLLSKIGLWADWRGCSLLMGVLFQALGPSSSLEELSSSRRPLDLLLLRNNGSSISENLYSAAPKSFRLERH